MSRRNGTVVFGPHLDLYIGPGSRASPLKDLSAAHDHFDRLPSFVRHNGCGWLHIGGELAAEAAADLAGDNLDLGDRHVEHFRHLRADLKRPLRAHPHGDAAVVFPPHGRVVRLNVALVNGGRVEFALDDHVGLGKARFEVAHGVLIVGGDVALLARVLAEGARGAVFVEQWGVVAHGLADIHDRLQDLVFDLD